MSTVYTFGRTRCLKAAVVGAFAAIPLLVGVSGHADHGDGSAGFFEFRRKGKTGLARSERERNERGGDVQLVE